MNTLIEQLIENVPNDVFTDTTVKTLVEGSVNSRYGLVKRAIKRGDLIHLRRGLYALSKKYRRHGMNLYEIAQRIYGPSYISFESALSHHGWIPEAVYTITSACSVRSKEVKTPLGLFSYAHTPFNNFFAGVKREQSPDGIFFMATPWRALVDYVYFYKKDWAGIQPLIEDLRVDAASLKEADLSVLNELGQSLECNRIKNFIEGIQKELV